MTYEQYKNFVGNRQVLYAMEKALGIKRRCFVESSTANSLTINVGPLYSSKIEPVKNKREEANCVLHYCYQNTAYYVQYDDNAQKELLQEIKELFPNARIIRFKHNNESGAQVPVIIPYADWFRFAEESGSPFVGYTAQELREYLEQIEKKVEKTLEEQFGLEYPTIKYTYGSMEIGIHFSDLYLRPNNLHLLDKYDVYSDGGCSKTILYTDKNKKLIREQLQAAFQGLEVCDFATSGVVKGTDGRNRSQFGLWVNCFCSLEKL